MTTYLFDMIITETKNPLTNARIAGKGVDPEKYHRQATNRGHKSYVMSRGELCEFMHCPARWIAGYEKKDTDSSEWGSLVDALLLDEGRFDERFAVEPATYPKDDENKKWNNNATFCREWCDEQRTAGKTIVSRKDKADADRAVSMLLTDVTIALLVSTSETQVAVIGDYEDAATGLIIPVKALIDLVPLDISPFGQTLIDFKTAYSAAPGVWARAVCEHNYHVQAALYLDLYTAATGEDRNSWLHIIQESYYPFQVGKRMLSCEFIELGRLKYTAALRRYAQCLAANEWPGYECDERKINWKGFELVEPEAYMLNR